MATLVSSGGTLSAGDPVLNHPFLTEQHSANPAARPSLCLMYHSPVTSIACLAGRKIHSQAWISHCLLRGSGEGCEEERDAVNKPRLNRLLGAVQAEPH